MGATKIDDFTESQNELAVLAKALGHPARIAIMEYLLKVDACFCGDIVNELPPFTAFERIEKCRPHKRKHRRKFYLLLYQ